MNIKLLVAIKQAGKRQGKVAGEAGMSDSRLSQIVNERREASPDERRELARVLRTSQKALGFGAAKE